ncbi:thiamine diphosphokinase [Spirochaeta cellobiosiphila]|uniref:thiamine diphosphokinase n=1 Tax=Spirochaeta cellobiosiphila TaxID=504483 RepID=UPI00042950AA|nr:thiamine diphosphokinase [Spirochaeta cellobiosiphila]
MKHKGIVISGGQGPDSLNFDLSQYKVVAADSGYDYAKKYNIKVDLIVGDMDSIAELKSVEENNDIKIMKFIKDKDYSDTELAIKYLYKYSDHIELLCGDLGRIDHLLNNLAMFEKYFKLKAWYGNCFTALRVSKGISNLNFELNTVISLFPISNKAMVTSRGLKWELEQRLLTKKDFSLSNVVKESSLVIKVLEGEILLIVPKNL